MTGSLSKKRRAGREATYPVAVIAEKCPRCGADFGEKCTEPYGGETIWRATPHRMRIVASKPLI